MLFSAWFNKTKRTVIRKSKVEALKVYLKALQGARLGLGMVLLITLSVQLFSVGLIVLIAAAFYLSPLDMETKAWIAFGLGSALFLIPLTIFIFALSQQVWYRWSGAERMVQDVLQSDTRSH